MKPIPTWREAIKTDLKLSILEAMQQEIDALRKTVDRILPRLELLREQNIEQWDEIVMLRNDADQHASIVKIYLDKITRLQGKGA